MPNPAVSTALVNLYASPSSAVAAATPVGGIVRSISAAPHGIVEWATAYPVLAAGMIAGGVSVTVGLLTFTGVVLGLGNSRKESQRDREHAAQEAHRERLATMRREVYMEAVGELVKAQAYLGALAQKDISKENPYSGMRDLNVAVGRIAVVADQKTALKARALAGRLSIFVLHAMRVLVPLNAARYEADTAESMRADSHAQVGRVLAEMNRMNEQGAADPARFQNLRASLDMHSNFVAQHVARRNRARLEQNGLEMEYVKLMREEIMPLMLDVDDMVCAIRIELGIEADLALFREQAKTFKAQHDSALEEVIEQWKGVYDRNFAEQQAPLQ